MPVPAPIGPIHTSEPRAVKLRDPENLSTYHSAVSGTVNIYVDSMSEANAMLAAWQIIMQAAADKAQEVLTAMRNQEAQ